MYSKTQASYLFHHIFLPPKTPQCDDATASIGHALVDLVIDALRDYGNCAGIDPSGFLNSLIDMFEAFRRAHDAGNKDILEDELELALGKIMVTGGSVPLYVRRQNAAVIVRQHQDQLRFEFFEVSPPNETVMTTKGRVVRTFPASAVDVLLETAKSRGLCQSLSRTLARMSHQSVSGQQPRVKKAGAWHDEDRDTTNPSVVLSFLNNIMAGIGERVDTAGIVKHTREQISWQDARTPWRRDPVWLVLRIVLQLGFQHHLDDASSARAHYKQVVMLVMCKFVQSASLTDLDSDVLHVIKARLCRKLLKLGAMPPKLRDLGQQLSVSIHTILQSRWEMAQRQDAPLHDFDSLRYLNFAQDSYIKIPRLEEFLQILKNAPEDVASHAFQPLDNSVIFDADILPFIDASADHITLHAMESWVALHLDPWTDQQKPSKACVDLASLLRVYQSAASTMYAGDALALSLMVLVSLELWAACDRLATQICPLLKEYTPGIQASLLQTLLLTSQCDLERLARVEAHLSARKIGRYSSSLLFQHGSDPAAFSARFFDQSDSLQKLRVDVEIQAQEQRERKIQEWRSLRDKYHVLMYKHDQSTCDLVQCYVRKSGTWQSRHSGRCTKCLYKSQAAALTLDVHEWPLPINSALAKTILFELQIPVWFDHWRDMTVSICQEVLGARYVDAKEWSQKRDLSNDPHLGRYNRRQNSSARIGLSSSTKSHVGTHRRGREIVTASKDEICLGSGLRYQYFDMHIGCPSGTLINTDKVLEMCTFSLCGESGSLQPFLRRPDSSPHGPAPNLVISSQSTCPQHLSLPEYKELCSIPYGIDLQWFEILAQVTAPSVDLKRPETLLLVLQCIYQVGEPATVGMTRPSHIMITELEFGMSLLKALEEARIRIKPNWESTPTLDLLTAIARRCLTSTSHRLVKHLCVTLICNSRHLAFDWALLLYGKFLEAEIDEVRQEFQKRSLEAALVCASTFDLDPELRAETLDQPEMSSILLQCSILIHRLKGQLIYLEGDRCRYTALHRRHERVLFDVHDQLAKSQKALTLAVQATYHAYLDGTPWTVSLHAAHWVTSSFVLDSAKVRAEVYLNLLSGEFLVNGRPLDYLPREYRDHHNYRTLFGHACIEIFPNPSSWVECSSKQSHHGYALDFGWCQYDDALEFVLRASDNDEVYTLLPSVLFRGLVPDIFVDQFIHFYNHKNHVEFRPRQQPWSRHNHNTWTLRWSNDAFAWQLFRSKDGARLLGLQSDTTNKLGGIFAPLSDTPQMALCLDPDTQSLEVTFDTLNIRFSLSRGHKEIFSKDFPGSMIDRDQNLGALVGFRNKLLITDGVDRKVLVLQGEVTIKRSTVGVSASTDVRGNRGVLAFSLDTHLCRFVGNGTLLSELFLAYISAVTSFCLVDPTTRKTGTEYALSILRSASVRSFSHLSQAEADVLESILSLVPRRQYYPSHERVMESITWDSELGFLAQHSGLHEAVHDIVLHARRAHSFHPAYRIKWPTFGDIDQSLLRRDSIRSSIYHIDSFGAEQFTTTYDVIYSSRPDTPNVRAREVYGLSRTIFQSNLVRLHPAHADATLWEMVKQQPRVNGCDIRLEVTRAIYDGSHATDGLDSITQNWMGICALLTKDTVERLDKFMVIFWLSSLSLCPTIPMATIEILAQLYLNQTFRTVAIPHQNSYCTSDGLIPLSMIKSEIQDQLRPLHLSPEESLPMQAGENYQDWQERRHAQFTTNQGMAVRRLIACFSKSWFSTRTVSVTAEVMRDNSAYVDVDAVIAKARDKFDSCAANAEFYTYLATLETLSSRLKYVHLPFPRPSQVTTCDYPTQPGYVDVKVLLRLSSPRITQASRTVAATPCHKRTTGDCSRLEALLSQLEHSEGQTEYQRAYIQDLRHSLNALQQLNRVDATDHHTLDTITLVTVSERYEMLAQQLRDIEQSFLDALCDAQLHGSGSNRAPQRTAGIELEIPQVTDIEHSSIAYYTLQRIERGPRINPQFFLQMLEPRFWETLNSAWASSIIAYGISTVELQRQKRIMTALAHGRSADAKKESENSGHINWNPAEHPECLLLEVESNILIRPVQAQIAQQMRSPAGDDNTSMQLNMGQGKSTVIVPIVAAGLADESRLVRVIVAKPQSRQMAQMLISKLGGMLNRRVYFLPFSRSLKLTSSLVSAIHEICQECMRDRGVLLVQPEHILSFQLAVLERPIVGDVLVGQQLLQTHQFLAHNSRDIVDESDENFSVKFELIYTMGCQRPIELGSERWNCIAEILSIVNDVAFQLVDALPDSFDFRPGKPGSFPSLRVLREDGGALLIKKVGERICQDGLSGLPIATQNDRIKDALFVYMTRWKLTVEEAATVEDPTTGFWTDSVQPKLLLLRGILAGNVLLFALSTKRWAVNYGLNLNRQPPTRLAVPYKAKDQPSPRADFSHPDVVIILTLLTYYYCGLTDENMYFAFENLLEYDQRDAEYSAWTRALHDLSPALHHLQAINLKDRTLCTSTVFPYLRSVKSVVDFFLSRIVFPKELRVFPEKLSSSGWDLGRRKRHLTTAFSGTCDTHPLLPLSVKYLALPEQQHTNALVLNHLLQSENGVCLLPAKRSSDVEWMLSTVMDTVPMPRVLLDVGAQILDESNETVAKIWLDKHGLDSAEAAIFVDDQDEVCVVDRNGHTEHLQASPFVARMETCLVYLDEAHTRGIDLRLPLGYRAAVTLGPNLTKDRLVQACMRMRQLGNGHSVVFMVSPEMRVRIFDSISCQGEHEMTTADVLEWAIMETHADLRRSLPLWAAQGKRYIDNEANWSTCNDATRISLDDAESFLEPEAKSLEQRYRPRSQSASCSTCMYDSDVKYAGIATRCQEIDRDATIEAPLEEEQEKELSPEMEEERHVEKPAAASPAKHSLHSDVVEFALSGLADDASIAYIPAFFSLQSFTGSRCFDVDQFARDSTVFVTRDFDRTIERSTRTYTSDDYLRSVSWVLTPKILTANSKVLIVSPFEAQALMPTLRSGKACTVLHIFKPRWNDRYPALNRLDFFSYPSIQSLAFSATRSTDVGVATITTSPTNSLAERILAELTLFAGRTNFSSQEEYQSACRFLGLAYENEAGSIVSLDGYVTSYADGRTGRYSSSPVAFIKHLTNVRSHHRDLTKTHVGKMLMGIRLHVDDSSDGTDAVEIADVDGPA